MARLRSVAQWQSWARVRLVLWRIRSYHYNYHNIYYHYLVNDYGSRDNYDNNRSGHDYNGGRKGYYNPAVNYDYLYDSGSTASPATAASRANND